MTETPARQVDEVRQVGPAGLPAQLPPIGFRTAQETARVVLAETRARPAPLGLVGFGFTTALLSLHVAGLLHIGSVALQVAIACGGAVQLAGAVVEWRRGNRFATLAFGSYAAFWLSLAALALVPASRLAAPSDHRTMAAYLFLWGIFTLVLSLWSLRTSAALMATFFLLAIQLLLLAFADAAESETLTRAAGYEGFLTGLAAVYLGASQVVNAVCGREVLPIGDRA